MSDGNSKCVSYKPGDEGFIERRKTMRQIEKIRGLVKPLILAEFSTYHGGRRHESSGEV